MATARITASLHRFVLMKEIDVRYGKSVMRVECRISQANLNTIYLYYYYYYYFFT